MNASPINPASGSTVWFMLFYDVVLAAAFGQTAHFYSEEPTWLVMGFIVLCNLALYLLWILTSFDLLVSSGSNPVKKVFGLFQMLSIALTAIALGWDSDFTFFWGLLGLAVSVFSLAGMILSGGDRDHSRRIVPWIVLAGIVFVIGALLSLWGIIPGQGWPIVFFIAGLAIMALSSGVVLFRRAAHETAIEAHEIQERFGMLLLIVLGEAFVLLIDSLGASGGIPQPLYFLLTIVVVFAIWLLYFPELSAFSRPKTARQAAARFGAHFVLIVTSSNAVAAYASQALLSPSPGEHGWGSEDWTSVPLVVVLLALIWLNYLDKPGWNVIQTIHAVAAVIILILALLGGDDNTDFGGITLALSAVILLADALLTSTLIQLRKKRMMLAL